MRERSLTPREVTSVTKRRRPAKARQGEASAETPPEAATQPAAHAPAAQEAPSIAPAIASAPAADAPGIAPGILALLGAYAEEEGAEHAAAPAAPRRPFAERARDREGSAELLLFRVGREWFGLELGAVEEAVERPVPQAVPDAPRGVLGVFPLRGRSLPTFAPDAPLGTGLTVEDPVALVIGDGATRIALLVDLVDDVLHAPLAALREAPGTDDGDGVLLGVLWRDGDLVAVLDAAALVRRCTHGLTIAAA